MRTFPRVPQLSDPDLVRHLRDFSLTVQKELADRTPDDVGGKYIHLVSPNGSVFQVSVDDAGALTATKVLG